MTNTTIIAYLGKGGTGKTILSSLTGKIAIEKGKKVLFIDADPTMGLTSALAVNNVKTIGKAREEIIQNAKKTNNNSEENIEEMIDYLLLESLYECAEYSMFVMGYSNTIGCYCPINTLLRNTINSVAEKFDIVIIDAEAGIEQINRQVTQAVHYPILVSDNSMRGAKTTILASETIKNSPSMSPIKTGVIFNRVEHLEQNLCKVIQDSDLKIFGSIPVDINITDVDKNGFTSFGINSESCSIVALRKILENEQIL